MYLLDTHVISERRKGVHADIQLGQVFSELAEQDAWAWLSVIKVGELQRGIDLIRHRGDVAQSKVLADWLHQILDQYADHILEFGIEEARLWGRLRVPHPENVLDKQIAATALMYDLTLVTRNVRDFAGTGVRLLNPFE